MRIHHAFKHIVDAFVTQLGKITWNGAAKILKGRYYDLTKNEQNTIRQKLTTDYFIILTRRKTHLSTYAINLSHFFLTGRWGYYSHALMNCENEVTSDDDFLLVEATNATGVAVSSFGSVFDCDSVALLKPKHITLEEWTLVLDKLRQQEGKQYDTLYNLKDDRRVSCVELVRIALMTLPDYNTKFANFEKMINESKNLDPHMYYTCGDFEVVYEVRH